jgi:CBS domain-containing protein
VKRIRIDNAPVGELSAGRPAAQGREGHEAVALAVRGGEVATAVSAGTAEERVVSAASRIRGRVRLENERVLTFDIHRAAGRASLRDEPARLREAGEEHSGASLAVVQDGDLLAGLGAAEDIMTRDVLTASPDELVEDIAKRLVFHNVTGLPVLDWDDRVIGIVSEVDVIDKLGETIGDVMSTELTTVSRKTPVEEIAALMTRRRIKRVPVIAEGMLVGIVSRADIVRAFAARSASSA